LKTGKTLSKRIPGLGQQPAECRKIVLFGVLYKMAYLAVPADEALRYGDHHSPHIVDHTRLDTEVEVDVGVQQTMVE